MRELLQIGEEVRRIDQQGVMFTVFDRKHSMTAINIPARVSLSSPMAALWTDDPAYVEYLAAAFEMLWKQSVPAEERLQKLLEQGFPQN